MSKYLKYACLFLMIGVAANVLNTFVLHDPTHLAAKANMSIDRMVIYNLVAFLIPFILIISRQKWAIWLILGVATFLLLDSGVNWFVDVAIIETHIQGAAMTASLGFYTAAIIHLVYHLRQM